MLSTASPDDSRSDANDDGSATEYTNTTFAGLALFVGLLIGTVVGKFAWGRERNGARVFSDDRARLEEVSLLVGVQNNNFRDYKSVESRGHEDR